jgi:hypothetical protein
MTWFSRRRKPRQQPEPVHVGTAGDPVTGALDPETAHFFAQLARQEPLRLPSPEPGTDEWWAARFAALEGIHQLRERQAWRRIDASAGRSMAAEIAQASYEQSEFRRITDGVLQDTGEYPLVQKRELVAA